MSKKKLFIMCAAPGAGKSTWIKDHLHSFNGYTAVISRDKIRFDMVAENEEYFSKENQVYEKFVNEIKDGLNHCDNTIADATHISSNSRRKLLKSLGRNLSGVEVNAIIIDTCLAKCLEQNEMRKGTRSYVPKGAIRRMFEQFEMPILEEGFDNIYIYKKVGDKITYEIQKR